MMQRTQKRRGLFRNLTHSLRWRLLWVFVLFGAATVLTFSHGANDLVRNVWRQAARPLVTDYIDRLMLELGNPIDLDKAKALTQRLPIRLDISGPTLNWHSHPSHHDRFGPRYEEHVDDQDAYHPRFNHRSPGRRFLSRTTADGHRVVFGVDVRGFGGPGGIIGFSLFILLAIAGLAYGCVWLLLRPLKAIGQGVNRFAEGNFKQRIAIKRRGRDNELTDLADSVNHMADSIEEMLNAKRALLLAISHELRSPLTRVRLNTELLEDTPASHVSREALLRDIALMSNMISDLLEGERLADTHSVLQPEEIDLVPVVQAMQQEFPNVVISIGQPTVTAKLDAKRLALLMRNLLNNAEHYAASATHPCELSLDTNDEQIIIAVRDYGPGVSAEHLAKLSAAFYRPDTARTRELGGVGLGLYLCRMVAGAHGGQLLIEHANPGLRVACILPFKKD